MDCFRYAVLTGADANVSSTNAILENYTISNASGAAVTVTFYDDVDTSNDTPVEVVRVPAGDSRSFRPQAKMAKGISVGASSWTSLTVSLRFK